MTYKVRIQEGNQKQRIIGQFDEETNTFKKKIKGSRHIFRVRDAIGIDAEYFTKELLPKDATIRVLDTETNIVYEITATEYKAKGEYYHFKNMTGDHRVQLFLPREHWRQEKRGLS